MFCYLPEYSGTWVLELNSFQKAVQEAVSSKTELHLSDA